MIKNIDERIIAEGFHTGREVDVVTIQKSDYEQLKEQAERALGIELELLNMELTGVLKQNKHYREALEFYAEPKNWLPQNEDMLSLITMDYGNKAREALEGGE